MIIVLTMSYFNFRVLKENKLKKLPKRLFDGNMNKLFFM